MSSAAAYILGGVFGGVTQGRTRAQTVYASLTAG
jgi:hypothetical protein